MSARVPDPPPEEEGLRFHQALLNHDPTAEQDFAFLYLDWLIAFLEAVNPDADPHLREEAAGEAIINFIKRPRRYNPVLGGVAPYLRMAAQRDLINLLRKEGRHHSERISLASVELSDEFGKYLGREEDPSLSLQIREVREEAMPVEVREGLTPEELTALELLIGGEKRTAVYAEALGITHWPPEAQRKEVKKVKDKLNARLKRARSHDGTSH